MRRRLIVLAAGIAAALCGAVPAAAAAGGSVPTAGGSGVVSEQPVRFTPNVENGTVYALAQVGRTVFVGGSFDKVATADERIWFRRPFLFSYDLTTGEISDFAPDLDGTVYALAAGPHDTLYVGGSFREVNGVSQSGVTQLDAESGDRVSAFRATVSGSDVRSLGYAGGWLYLGGGFSTVDGQPRTALARVDPTTGALDSAFDAHLTDPGASRTKVEKLALSPDGGHLVAIGAISTAYGAPRTQLVMLNTAGAGSLSGWFTTAYESACDSAFDTYLRGVDFSPAGDYFAVVSTGRLTGPTTMCDSVARFDTAGSGPHKPVWVNHTGGHSLFAVAVTDAAVYVGGHELWLDNPDGQKTAGPGAVDRPGIGAVDPVGGKALPWNPTRTRGVGVQAFLVTSAGLIVGSDTTELGHEYHARLGMFGS